uniref:Uncharacterized protein n=1 Tax=Amphimedon queenslandica TaxID=400682 RepID=A0A1X7TQ92_AMPQE
MPSGTLRLWFYDLEFCFCLLYWMGVLLSSSPHDCPICDKESDPMGDTQRVCGGNGDRIICHNSPCEVIFFSAQAADLASRKEVSSLLSDSCSHPADIFLPSWSGGKPTVFDVTVISPI